MASIRNTFKQISADGRVGKNDLKKLLESALDGKGVTKNEAAELVKIKEKHGDMFTKKAGEAFDAFLSKMNRSWSVTKNVHLPNFDSDDMKALLAADPRASIYTGGGESSSARTRPATGGGPNPYAGGGESSSRSAPAPRRTGGGESYTPPRRSRPTRSWTSSNSWGSSSWGGRE